MLSTLPRPPKNTDMERGMRLSELYGQDITPVDVVKVLKEAKLKYILVGAHAANAYNGRPRTTIDVDIVAQYPKRAAKALHGAFPHLEVVDTPVVIRLKLEDGKEAVDVIKPETSKLFQRLLKLAVEVKLGAVKIAIPPVEGVLAAKFASMTSIGRRYGDRMQDATDFIHIVEANTKIHIPLLKELADLAYPGGSIEIEKMVNDVRAGKPINI